MRAPALLFCALFSLYLASLNPDLAAYRDAGELSASAYTLGVSHPPSYPVYILLARAASSIPVGGHAYRLGLLSAAAAALAAALLFVLARRRFGSAAAAAAALWLALNPTMWSVAIVQEMYSLWMLGAVVVLGLALSQRERPSGRTWAAFAFVYGLMLGNRLDLLLWAPGLLWLASAKAEHEPRMLRWASWAFLIASGVILFSGANWPIAILVVATALWLRSEPGRAGWALRSLGWALAGLSVYLYLPIRSAQGPWLDWNAPSILANFKESLLRTKYGGTLDLLSKNYATGAMFDENMSLYARHLCSSFGPVGLGAALAGAIVAWRADRRRCLGLAAMYWWSGPFFLLIANMPPNPHAAAIVEPHYLLSDLVLAFWAAEGVGWAALGYGRPAAAVALAAALLWPAALGRWRQSARRHAYFTDDFATNALRSLPPGAALVLKKDVPLYTLWHHQLARGRRPDARVVAQGLAGSPWYQKGMRRRADPGYLGALRDEAGWTRFVSANGGAYAAFDAELPGPLSASARPRGLLAALGPGAAASGALWELLVRRGDYSYEDQPDFFLSDLVDLHSQALFRLGSAAAARAGAETVPALLGAWAMHWSLPEPAIFLGYEAMTRKDYRSASRYYGLADRLYSALLGKAEDYAALPPVKSEIRRGGAEALMHLGVAHERLGDAQSADRSYQLSLERWPLAQTRYNRAVLYWQRDPAAAERELEAALLLEPGHADAARYLTALRQKRASRR